MGLEIRNATKKFDETLFETLNLEIKDGEILALLGPSGCGKTTLLRCICGLEKLDTGNVILNGEDVSDKAPYLREIGYLFQTPVLFPHLDVAGNLKLGDKDSEAVSAILEEVGLEGFENRNVDSLSGGEGQRIALARALLAKPKALLLDEPFSALDDDLRFRLIDEVSSLIRERKIPAIHVTHDVEEAEAISDRIHRL